MNIIKVKDWRNIPDNFTGIVERLDEAKAWFKEGKWHREDGPAVEYSNGDKSWYKEGKWHRLDGPAVIWVDGTKRWYLEGESYLPISLKNYVILDYSEGTYGLMWYKLLDEDGLREYPDIPGLINK